MNFTQCFMILTLTFSLKFINCSPPRIVGGVEVSPKYKYPFIVSLQKKAKNVCGGTLFNPSTVISAAHCTSSSNSDWAVLIHRHNLTLTSEEEGGSAHKVIEQIEHPNYNIFDQSNDVAIFKISPPAALKIQVELDDGTLTRPNIELSIAGWGATQFGGKSGVILREAKVPIVDFEACTKAYPDLNQTVHFCAGYLEGGIDTCQGDSGGPIFSNKDGKPILAGIVSFGYGCAYKNYPGVYSKIAGFSDFILKHASQSSIMGSYPLE